MNTVEHSPTEKPIIPYRTIAGGILVAAGAALFLDRYLQTRWLSLLVMPLIGVFLYQWGVRMRHAGLLAAGGLLGGLGFGVLLALNPAVPAPPLLRQAGYALLSLALGCLAVWGGTALTTGRPAWWALLVSGAVGAPGAALVIPPVTALTLAFAVGLGVGLPLLIWGSAVRLYGLVISGCLIAPIGAGVYLAWAAPQEANALLRTGVMLMWFSAGWVLITIFSRLRFNRYAWWPLIPGGILAMVGFGLYVGGDPDNALGIIGNTGSIALMIFGLYLLLMRKGIHH